MQQDRNQEKAIELWITAAKLGFSQSHKNLGMHYFRMKNSSKAKFHFGAATMAGHEGARCNLETMEAQSGKLSIGSLLHLLGYILPCIISGHSLKMVLLLKENLWTQL